MPTQTKQAQPSDVEREYALKVKEFFTSDAWNGYLMPMISQSLQKELPKPGSERWKSRYVYAFALSEAFSLIINTLSNMAGRSEFLKKVEKFYDGTEESEEDKKVKVDHAKPVDEA